MERTLMGNVRLDARPVRRQIVVTGPALQVGETRRERCARCHDRLRRRQPQETPVRQRHLWAEEIVVRCQKQRRVERDIEEDLLPCRWAFTAGELKLREPAALSRVADAISTSAGELTRLRTLPEGGFAESPRKTCYSSISALATLLRRASDGSRPVKVAESILVAWVRTKSSAVSVWSSPGPLGRDSVPISPSGLPVLKKKGAGPARTVPGTNSTIKSVSGRHN